MRRLLITTAAALLTCQPSFAFGDPVEAGVAAWCGARSRGASVDEANQQLRSTMAAQYTMSTGFAAALVGILGNRQGMQSQIEYRISRDCPEYKYGENPVQQNQPRQEEVVQNDTNHSKSGLASTEKVETTGYLHEGGIGIGFDCVINGKQYLGAKPCDSFMIRWLADGGPAQIDGRMRVGDTILEIDNQLAKGKTSKEIVALIGGKANTYVIIIIEASGKSVPIMLKRAPTSTMQLPKR
jgi:hypothetical protein